MEPIAYFRDKIEHRLSFLEERARKIDAPYRESVERVARQARDEVWARYIRDTMDPRKILDAIHRIRTLLDLPEGVIEADKELERLNAQILFVDSLLTRPYSNAGFRSVEGGRQAALRKHGTAAEQAAEGQEVCAAYDRHRANGKRAGKAEAAVAKKFGISTRTVRSHLSRRKKNPGKTS